MNIFALDIGDTRVGIAFGDTKTKISSPLKVISLNEILNNSKEFRGMLQDYMPELFVVGLPLSLNGEEHDQAIHIKEVAQKISKSYNIEIEFIDERLSSAEAKNILRQQGLSEKDMKGKIDSVAAALFLETYLMRKN